MSVKETNNMSLSTSNYFVQSKENLNTMSPISMRMMDPLKIFSSMPNFSVTPHTTAPSSVSTTTNQTTARLSPNLINNNNNNNYEENVIINSQNAMEALMNREEKNSLLNLPFFHTINSGNPQASSKTLMKSDLGNIFQLTEDNNQNSSSGSQMTPGMTNSGQSKGDDDFCNMCQKHFCNKYYLRKHKQDVHGIQSEPFSIARRRESSSSYNFTHTGNNNKDCQNETSLGNTENSLNDNNSNTDTLNLLKQNPLSLIPNFATILASYNNNNNKNTKGTNNTPFNPESLNSLSDLFQSKFPQLNSNNTSENSSNDQGEQGGNESKSLKASSGSGNLDSFKSSMVAAKLADRVTCELCKKELCNKYFLRTHKFKVHGISQNESSNLSNNSTSSLNNKSTCEMNSSLVSTTSNIKTTEVSKQSTKDLMESINESGKEDQQKSSPENTAPEDVGNVSNPAQEFFKNFMDTDGDKNLNGLANSKTLCPLCGVNVGIKFLLPGHLCQVHSLSITDPMFILCTLKANMTGNIEEQEEKEEEVNTKILSEQTTVQAGENLIKEPTKTLSSNLSADQSKGDCHSPKGSETTNKQMTAFNPTNLSLMAQNWPNGLNLSMFNGNSGNLSNSQLSNANDQSSPNFSQSPQQQNQGQQMINSKSPNQMRVLCDICNKWICNKYFLRTHKANKHGIYDGMMKPLKKKMMLKNNEVTNNTMNNNSGTQMLMNKHANIQNFLGPFMGANNNGAFELGSNAIENMLQHSMLTGSQPSAMGKMLNNSSPFPSYSGKGQSSALDENKFNFDPSKISQLLMNNNIPINRNNLSLDNLHIPLNLSLKEFFPFSASSKSNGQREGYESLIGKSFLINSTSPASTSSSSCQKRPKHGLHSFKLAQLRRRRRALTMKSVSQRRASLLVQRSCLLLRKQQMRNNNNKTVTKKKIKVSTIKKERLANKQMETLVQRASLPTIHTTSPLDKAETSIADAGNLNQASFQLPCIMCPNSAETYNLATLIEHFQMIHSKPASDLQLDSLTQGIFPNLLMPNLITAIGKKSSENLVSSTSSSSSSSGLEFESSSMSQGINLPLLHPFLLKMSNQNSTIHNNNNNSNANKSSTSNDVKKD